MATAAIVVVAVCSSTQVSKIQNILRSRNFSYPTRISAHNRVINNNRSLESSASGLLIRGWKGAERTKMEQSNGVLVVPRAKARGFREKNIAIISVKVYAAGLYVDAAITSYMAAWSGKLGSQIEQDNLFFNAVFEAPVEKSLQIVLVRDIDGKTFWGALDEALSARLKTTGAAEQKALDTFRETFQGRSLNRGTTIYLNWLNPSIMIVSISSDGCSSVADATIDSPAVAFALFDVYFGIHPVSLPLKKSVASGLASII